MYKVSETRYGFNSGGRRNGGRGNSNNSKRRGNSSRGSSRGRSGGRGRGRGRAQKQNNTPAHHYVAQAKPAPKQEVKKDTLRFDSLDLKSGLLSNLKKKGYEYATPIQDASIPIILEGKDLLGISATGSGKTGAFLIPMVQKLASQKYQQLLVVAPTRELAMQIHQELISLIKGSPMRATLVIGGASINRQAQELRRKPNIIIGTPGRLHDMQRRGHLHLNMINNIVLDEVDRMLDMGFVDEIREIFSMIADKRQSLFFSATIEADILRIISEFVESYETVKFGQNEPGKLVTQDVIGFHDGSEKIHKLKELLEKPEVEKSIVFVETKRYVDKVAKELSGHGYRVESIHGGKTQGRRQRAIKSYKDNRVNILVATNVAARGLDITDITHVINFDEPQTYDEYIHRIGRTGRNGNTGFAYTFIEAHRL